MNRLSFLQSSLRHGKQFLGMGSRTSRRDFRGIATLDYKPGDSLPHGWKVVKSTTVPELSLPGINPS